MKHKFAAQLFTVRDLLKDDFPGVLRELKEMGWAGVQISGLFGYSKEEIAAVLQETGLKVPGVHVGIDRLREDLQAVVEEAEAFNTKDIVCPFVPDELRTVEGYQAIKRDLNEIAKKLKGEGYRISYHNHDFEFKTTISGMSALEFMLDPDAENQVFAEIDTYWVKKAGYDPLDFIQKYAYRMPIIHLKDMTLDDNQTFAEVGTGSIDFKPILAWGEENGVEWYAVEQDECPGDPMESLQLSLDNLNGTVEKLATKTN
ncbi:sugar phosphate isomerase/epimerase [Alkalihalobacillus sp. TS-13]|uniref:sugar phosphate isomerase/epimerase family protein n=1 Tax=Alkalihalobacillus sp. TS-13 TaxID=2842455 RepID=UPI001C88469B|nr:sugar phosphate isomerase/epimerase [Alkalihalobacillus sp. TS-13]